MKKFKIEILTPEKTFYEGEIDSLVIETPAGKFGILAGHSPTAIGLAPSVLTMRVDGEELTAVNSDGFVQVSPEKTTVLCQTAEWPHEIEENRLRREIEDNERRLREAQSRVEYNLSKTALTRLLAKLKAINK